MMSTDEKLELERLLMIRDHWAKFVKPEKPVLEPLAVPETHEKSAKPVETKPGGSESQKGFIDKLCDKLAGPGSDRPSGRALGKNSWMG